LFLRIRRCSVVGAFVIAVVAAEVEEVEEIA
jgi:hypothetical protein